MPSRDAAYDDDSAEAFEGTLMDGLEDEPPYPTAANDHVREARDALRKVQTGRIWFGEAAECLDPIIDAIKALDRLAGLDNVRRAKA